VRLRFDRSVFLLHYHLAGHLGKQEELRHRYEFHLGLQRLGRTAWEQKARFEFALHFLTSRPQVTWEEVSDLKDLLGQASECLTEVFRQAGELLVPSLKNLKAGRPLVSLLPPEPDVPELSSGESYTALDLGPLATTHRQAAAVVERLSWIQDKSLGALLAFQQELIREASQDAANRLALPKREPHLPEGAGAESATGAEEGAGGSGIQPRP
jgi:hypothetical protein